MEQKQTMTDEELSQKLGQYQRTESIGILLGVLLVIAGIILAFVQHNVFLMIAPVFGGVILLLLLAQPAQKKKKALLQQELGGFFRAELEKAFGPEPETPELPIDWDTLQGLLSVAWTERTVSDFHEGVHNGLRFSAANVELRRTVEERSGPDNDNWMTRTETLFHGVVVRCKDLCDPALDYILQGLFQERKGADITDPQQFRRLFAVRTGDGRPADDAVTPQLRALVKELEGTAKNAQVGCLRLHGGELMLALNTRYLFASPPEALDLRDVDGIRKWYVASLTGMGKLLDMLAASPVLTGAAE